MDASGGRSARRRLRLLVGKVGLDGHDRGAKIIARALRDAGHEVIYTGLHQTPEQVVETAIQEDVDGIGLSTLSGAHLHLFQRVLELLRSRGAGEVTVFGGGIIPDEDLAALKEMGVSRMFRPGATTDEILEFLDAEVPPRRDPA
jgi:isobutyryl-CoA mutase small subunit